MKPKHLGEEAIVYQADRFSVKSADLTLSDNTRVKWEYPDFGVGIVIIPVNSKEQVLLVQEWRLPYKTEVLQLPSANSHTNDERKLVNLAQKLLQQEVGFSSSHLLKLGSVFTTTSAYQLHHIFLATELKRLRPAASPTHRQQVVFMPIKEAYHRVRKQTVSPASTTTGLIWAMEALQIIAIIDP